MTDLENRGRRPMLTNSELALVVKALEAFNVDNDPKLEALAGRLSALRDGDFDPVMFRRQEAYRNAVDLDDNYDCDPDAEVSESENGAHVMVWQWVSAANLGENFCRCCAAEYEDGGDGYDGLCPDCADEEYGNEEEGKC